jgi:hypothetical protein
MASRASLNRFRKWLTTTEQLPLPEELMEKTKICDLTADQIQEKAKLLGELAMKEYLQINGDTEGVLEVYEFGYNSFIDICMNELLLTALNNRTPPQTIDKLLLTIKSLKELTGQSTMENVEGGSRLHRRVPQTTRKKARHAKK